jgi:hypothetical protein
MSSLEKEGKAKYKFVRHLEAKVVHAGIEVRPPNQAKEDIPV